jgi:PspA-Associated protein
VTVVRILGSGQFRLDDSDVGHLNELDNAVAAAVAAGDGAGFGRSFGALVAYVREQGAPVPDGELVTSDHVLPAVDTTLEEAREAFSGEGAIPG